MPQEQANPRQQQKKKKAILKKLAETAQALAEQQEQISTLQKQWFLEGCVVCLRELGISFSQAEQAWQHDQEEKEK